MKRKEVGALISVNNGAEKKVRGDLVLRPAGALIIPEGPKRTSGLLAPNMCLKGHESGVHCARFNREGSHIASGSTDKTILLWNVYGECKNWGVLKGHEGAILDICWDREGTLLYSASADQFGAVWDVETEERVKKLRDHKSYVNAVSASRRGDPLVLTGSDDCTTMLWDVRIRGHQIKFQSEYQVLAVSFADDSTQMFSAGIDGVVYCWDIRANKVVYKLQGHKDTITGISVSADGNFLLSNSMDNTLISWDVRPYISPEAGQSRVVRVFEGGQHDFQQQMLRCSWSSDGEKVSAGSSDCFVYVWDAHSSKVLYKLPGHSGCVNDVDFHPKEPVILSSSNDRSMFLGEIL